MSDTGNSQANLAAEEAAPVPRGRGRPKGSRNRATRDVRALTQRKGSAALRELWKLCTLDPDSKVRMAALDKWLAYAFGRPVDRQELTGADGSPLNPASGMGDFELAQRVAFMLTKATHERRPAAPVAERPHVAPEIVSTPPEPIPSPDPEPEPEAAANVVSFPEARPQPLHTPAILQRDQAS